MKKTLMLQVEDSILKVMETMFYFTVEKKKDVSSDLSSLFDQDSLKACRITFSGSYSGAIFLLIPLNVLIAMARNFLGRDQDSLSAEYIEGTLKEALNMIAGNALTKLDEKSYTGLGIPELVDSAIITSDENAMIFNTAEGMMASVVRLDD